MDNTFAKELEDLGIPTGMDVEKFKQKVIEKKNENSETSPYLKLPYGETVVRILPPYNKDRAGQYSEEYLQHKLGSDYITCSRKAGEPVKKCPICMLANSFYNSEDPNEKSISKFIYAHKRYLINVIVKEYRNVDWEKSKMEKPAIESYQNKVFVFDASLSVVNIIEKYIIENGDVTDVLQGKDFVIRKGTKTYDNGLSFVSYEGSSFEQEPSYLANSPEVIKGILGSQHNLEKIVGAKRKTFSELLSLGVEHFNSIGNFRVVETLQQLSNGEHVIHTQQHGGQQQQQQSQQNRPIQNQNQRQNRPVQQPIQQQTQFAKQETQQQQQNQPVQQNPTVPKFNGPVDDDLSFEDFANEIDDI